MGKTRTRRKNVFAFVSFSSFSFFGCYVNYDKAKAKEREKGQNKRKRTEKYEKILVKMLSYAMTIWQEKGSAGSPFNFYVVQHKS
jgi:hypothetical protein